LNHYIIAKILTCLNITSPKDVLNLPKFLNIIVKKFSYFLYSASFRGLIWLLIMYFVKKIDYFAEFTWWDQNLLKRPEVDPKKREWHFPKPLLKIIYQLREQNEEIEVLEVGSGPISNLVWAVEQNLIKVTALDPLAHLFRKLLKKHKLSYPITPKKGYGEDVNKLFKRETFDVVFSRNVLDHTISPKVCINNMYFVLKPNGILHLEGFLKEGTHTGWIGLHKHDLVPENGHLIHYNKKGIRTNLTADLNLKCIYEQITHSNPANEGKPFSPGDWYFLLFRKYNDSER